MALNEKLKEYRKLDQGQMEQTLHPDRLRAYLQSNQITVDNFEEKFKIATALDIAKQGNALGDKQMHQDLKNAIDFVAKNKIAVDWEETTPETFNATLHTELTKLFPADEHALKKNELLIIKAYSVYHEAVRKVAQKSLELRKEFEEQRGEHKDTVEGKIWDSVKSTLGEVLGPIGKNWDKMKGGEKVVAAGALIGIGAYLSFGQGKAISWIRDKALKGLKFGGITLGVSVGANYLYKLFTGESIASELADWNNATAGNPEMWQENFDTDEDGAEKLQKSVAVLGKMEFPTLAAKYKAAKAANGKKIDLGSRIRGKMSPEDVYAALDTFFKKYPVDELITKYASSTPPPTWLDVVTNELSESGKLDPPENIAGAAVETVEEGGIRLGNAILTLPGIRSLYLWKFGREGSDAEVIKYAQEVLPNLTNDTITEDKDVEGFLKRKFGKNGLSTRGYIEAIKSTPEPNSPMLKSKEINTDADKNIYLVSEVELTGRNPAEKDKLLADTANKAYQFLKARYKQEDAVGNISKMLVIEAGTYVIKPVPKYKLFMRLPLPGSAEYLSHIQGAPKLRQEAPAVEIFDENSELKYTQLAKESNYNQALQERMRIRFLLDSTQGALLQKICDWYKGKYQGQQKSKKEVIEAMIAGSDDERDQALKENAITPDKQGLLRGKTRLDVEVDKITEIEKEAADDYEGSEAYAQLIEYMRNSMGYKVRLAVLGDSAARVFFASKGESYDSAKDVDWLSNIKTDYEERCEELVDKFAAG